MPFHHANAMRTRTLLTVLTVCTVAGAAHAGDIIQYQKLLAGDGETPDFFGASVDTFEERMIVGAKYANFDFILDCGAAYVWKRVGPTSWEAEAKLTAPDAVTGDVFGIASALGDDVALVGAYFDDVKAGNDNAGSVYSFTRALDGTWSFHQMFFAPGALGGETFGVSIDIDGDAAIIGASGSGAQNKAGAAHVFRRDMAGDWILEQSLAPTDSQPSDQFGWSVDIDGNTAVVGAWNNDAKLGAIYVYTRDAMTGVWDSGVKVTADTRITDERLGWSVSISGDTILAGATQELTTGTGAVYVFRSDGMGGWIQEARLVGAEAGPRDQVGRSVELSGDRALIGAVEHGIFPIVGDNGSVYAFRRTAGVWTQTHRIRASDGQGDDQFGNAIAIHNDLLIIGARAEDDFGFNAGAAYIFDAHDAFCPWDINHDFVTDTADLGLLIAAFGGVNPDADLNDDGVVDTADLGLLIAAFGSICD